MSGRISVFVFLLCVVVSMAVTEGDLVVDTNSGRIRGVRFFLPTGKSVDAFLGIPFAKAPIGPLRFRHPQPVDPWKGTYNATRLPNSCYQTPDTTFGPDFWGSDMWNPPTRVSEDCLYLNIWVPTGVRQSAVMVWIFGGGFYSGTTALSLYDGGILAAEGRVVVASVGYRVGVFGFFHLDAASAPANVGLFDQLMGLDWIRDNAAAFGGDPGSITLFGESAGGASVGLHLLSPISRGRFHRAILQSGAANMPWATVTAKEARRRSLELAVEVLGCPAGSNDGGVESMETVAECVRGLSPQTLVEYQYVTSGALQFPFLPVVDGTFLPDRPEVLIRRRNFKRCPVLMGSNRNEGSYFLIYELLELLTLTSFKMTRDDFVTSVRKLFYYYPQFRHVVSQAAVEAIIFQYTDWTDPEDGLGNVLGLDLALGDSQFVCPLNRFAQAYSSAGERVYTYYLTQRYQGNPWPRWMGVLHGDDVLFVFGEALKPRRNFSREDQVLSRLMIKYWTNFAKTGDPNLNLGENNNSVVWPLHTPAGREYLELNAQHIVDGDAAKSSRAIGRGPRIRECAFWDEYLPRLLSINNTDETSPQHQKNTCNGVGGSAPVVWPTSPYAPAICLMLLLRLDLHRFFGWQSF